MAVADVKIFDFTVYPGKVEGDTAQVPNVLESQDKFVNTLGLTEHELYTLVQEDGSWKVDSADPARADRDREVVPRGRRPADDSRSPSPLTLRRRVCYRPAHRRGSVPHLGPQEGASMRRVGRSRSGSRSARSRSAVITRSR